ncbi:hypothetical protein [Streptomyces brevispora]|uniref:Antibiotic biosynthesis monooxygenase n=1 Tax=Streptomyces brevispora TaxID=887462 RepID=A0ABZ1G734_9ACTN|nr:hypothetical protein [Streptomyces brevispora]WSC15700.1 hypothetical protein OIE64_24625 [Streptomyces brevispora]
MSLQMVRFRTDKDTGGEVRSQLAKVFAALRAASPQGVVYTAYSSASETDVILALETAEEGENPLVGLAEAAQLRDLISRAAGAPVAPEQFVVVGTYHS